MIKFFIRPLHARRPHIVRFTITRSIMTTKTSKPHIVSPPPVVIPGTYPEINPLDFVKSHIAASVASILKLDPAVVYNALQRTQSLDKGDLALATPALRIKGTKPDAIAEQVVAEFPPSPLIDRLEVTKIHISFYFNASTLGQLVLPGILENRTTWGNNPALGLKNLEAPDEGKKRIIIEFSSPNVAKPFHQGHLRSTIIGGFLTNLYRIFGWDVISMNYLGDWGKQYGLLALAYELYGNEKALEEDPIQHLFQLYVKINAQVTDERDAIKAAEDANTDATELKKNSFDERARQYFKAMCDKEPKAIALWSKFRDLSIERYKEVYARLNIHFDEYTGESQVQEESMKAAEKLVTDAGLSSDSNGATVVKYEDFIPGKLGKQLGVALLRKQDGTSLYLTRDLGAIFERLAQFQFDKMIYVVAQSQQLHLQQLFKLVEMIDKTDLPSKLSHVGFGLVRGMSTRKGTVVFLDDVLKEAAETMHNVMRKNDAKYAQVENPDKVADILGISSVMVQDMSGKRINGYDFNLEAVTTFEGDTGPYLQYSHARLNSIIRKAGVPLEEIKKADLNILKEQHAFNIIRSLAQYPDILLSTYSTLEPTNILTYLFRLTHYVNSSYDVLQVLGSPDEVLKARLALYDAARCVIANGMRLLGLSPLERM